MSLIIHKKYAIISRNLIVLILNNLPLNSVDPLSYFPHGGKDGSFGGFKDVFVTLKILESFSQYLI